MARCCSSTSLGTRTSASASWLPCTKAVQFQAKRFGIQPVGFDPFVALIEFLGTDHIGVDAQNAELPLERKTKTARFIDGIHFGATLTEPGGPVQKGFFGKALRWLGVGPFHLLHHNIKVLLHINPELDAASAAAKLAAGSLV